MDNKEKGRAILLGILIVGGGHLYMGEIKKGLTLFSAQVLFAIIMSFFIFSQELYLFIALMVGLYAYSIYDLLCNLGIVKESNKIKIQSLNSHLEQKGTDNDISDLKVIIVVSIYIAVMVLIIWYS
ncbi:hypothetical protein HYX15_03275 [Candidatus Woesearchaeota archaeon]|nr:hypothetical protein [Candidatus Woesearchaeota archaeon]